MSEEVVGEVNMEEVNSELLECARYGEDDDLRMLLGQYHGDVNHRDAGGNTALHRAAANGHIGCMQILLEFKAAYLENDEGNWPSHWAVQNAQPQALKFLFDNYPVDVLAKNKVGKSTLTEAFQCNNQEILGMCMTHESCTEERLLAGTKTKVKENADGEVTTSMTAADEKGDSFEEEVAANDAVTHLMNLLLESGLAPEASSSSSSSSSCASANVGDETASSTAQPARVVKVRELPITRADNPFGSDERPEDDTTGLGIWPASILLSRWAVALGNSFFNNKVVVELGAGCGLPGLATAVHCGAKKVYITDIHDPTLDNAAHNLKLNVDVVRENSNAIAEGVLQVPSVAHETVLQVKKVNWKDESSFPEEKADIILGSDLVYDIKILDLLVPALKNMLTTDGEILYVAPDTGRDGMAELVARLAQVNLFLIESAPVPERLYANPLVGDDEDQFILHFYDLSAKQPHTFYRFAFGSSVDQPAATSEVVA